MKRLLDIIGSLIGLIVSSPILAPVMFLIWKQDRHSPFYIAPRVGMRGREFRMVKLRSMVVNADKTGVDSTSSDDNRITSVGRFVRRYKLDELPQLWNVLKGDMSLVGPRPNVKRETDLYTSEERELLSVRPGVTDFSSIVFSDEGEILQGAADPDLEYNRIIRPWKSRLGILYVRNKGVFLDLILVLLTVLAIISRVNAIKCVHFIVSRLTDDKELLSVIQRVNPPHAAPPPGSDKIVSSRAANG